MTRLFGNIFKICVGIYVFFFAYEWWHPMPDELLSAPKIYQVPDSGIHFFADTSYLDTKKNTRVLDQHIWGEIEKIIGKAKHVITLDMFLYNDFQGSHPEVSRKLSQELTEALVNKRTAEKHIAIALITDPINTVYGGVISPYFERLTANGIVVITTDLSILPDSNVPWSALWHPFLSWTGNSTKGGWLKHPFDDAGGKVTLRSWFALLNMKANHRKILVADQPIVSGKNAGKQKMVSFVTSSNPHDGSSANGNVALQVDDKIWQEILSSERSIASLSGAGLPNYDPTTETADADGAVSVSLLREEFIKSKVLERIAQTKPHEQLSMVMFYLSERDIVKALIDASNRGVNVRLILDPNNDAFGHNKYGIPNQPVAKELAQRSNDTIQIRWCSSSGEQCHAKLFFGSSATSSFMMLGSANFTRRNIGGFNLESDIYAEGPGQFKAWADASAYFDKMWQNAGGTYTADYGAHKDDTIWKSSLYRVMEFSGMSSF